MNQEITYSTDLIEFLHSDSTILEISNQKKVWELIKQNYVVSDSDLRILKDYGVIIQNLPVSTLRQELQSFLDGLIQNKAKKRKTFYLAELGEEFEIELAKSTNDRIYFNPLLNDKQINNLVKKHSTLESHNELSFISPQPIHRLKHLPTIINLEKGCYYDLNIIIDPFLREANNIRIEDPYLPNPLASYNALKIIKRYRNIHFDLVFLTVKLFVERESEKQVGDIQEQYESFISKLESLKKDGYKINYENYFNSRKHRERYIFTEEFQIYLPGGFDFLTREGYVNNSDNNNDKKEIRIELLAKVKQ